MPTNTDVVPILPTGSDAPPILAVAVPAGAPRWVTPELFADTIRVWEPYYGELDFRGCPGHNIECWQSV